LGAILAGRWSETIKSEQLETVGPLFFEWKTMETTRGHFQKRFDDMDVSENSGTPKSSIKK